MQKFELVLKNEKRKFYDRFAIFIFILNGIAVCLFLSLFFLGLSNYQKLSETVPGFVVLILTSLLLFLQFYNKTASIKEYAFYFAAASIVLYWTFIRYWWVGLIMLGLFFLYLVSKRKLIIVVQAKNIIYPSFPKTNIEWTDLNNIIIKDGLLTIDFKNNKIIQQLIDENKTRIDQKEFNEFCKQQLKVKEVI
jgi:hypothetical protein